MTLTSTVSRKLSYQNPLFILAQTLFVISLGLEYVATSLALNGDLLNAFIIHLVASLCMPWSLCYFMPTHLRSNMAIQSLLFLLCLLIPIVSGVCLFCSLTLALYFRKQTEESVYDYFEPLNASELIDSSLSKANYSNGKIFGILRFSKDKEKRIKAVLSTNQIADEIAIPILRVALLDSVDEVRLLAYSILDNKEKDIDLVIHQGLNQLKSNQLDPKETRRIHHRLAEAYWELSYMGLVNGRARNHTLQSAKNHANEALKLNTKGTGLLLLQSQILTALGYFKEASSSLEKVKQQGVSVEKLAARNAELAFELKRFAEVTQHIKKLDKLAENNIILDGMVKQWN